ncbi:hypothetical protein [Streptomyces pilosus]|uniref:Uncharacterized protein n=1 Tax=Streptomyces pilosus TaxID=28893 RepID=A0A918C7R1_9ACTN|nr:hypothetical protein [Streptomyces pilosus]GGR08966.1 hypothetical protein GCM10010280_65970 [Streptomyces pilosus]
MNDEGNVADPALPDGVVTGYFGIPLASSFRREQQCLRATIAVFTSDPSNPLAGYNKQILQVGLPGHALATDIVAVLEGERDASIEGEGPLKGPAL